jgi:hypothetical protein
MVPQILHQRLVGRIRLGRENQVGKLVLQAATSQSLAVTADVPCRMTVTKIEASPEQRGYPARKTHRSPRRWRRHLVGASQ